MPKLLDTSLDLERCPHCNVDNPLLKSGTGLTPMDYCGNRRFWRIYMCSRCAGVVVAESSNWDGEVLQIFPSSHEVSNDIPERARHYLQQAISSLNAPAGSVMLAASSVDAMLKSKGLKDGSLYSRIQKAAQTHLITEEMSNWAHDVRLDANDQRHADEEFPLPTNDQARKCIDFASALGQFLFVLPAQVSRGRTNAIKPTT